MCGSGFCAQSIQPSQWPTNLVTLFHESCFTFRLFNVSQGYLNATKRNIQPTPNEERRREARIRRLLAPRLAAMYPGKLPIEMWHQIAGELTHECATVSSQMHWNDSERVTSSLVSDVHFALDVYVSYELVEGVRYLRFVENLDTLRYHKWRPLSTKDAGITGRHLHKSSTSVSAILIGEDGLGIRHVEFRTTLPDPSDSHPFPGLWWRLISVKHCARSVKFINDVSLTEALRAK